MVVFCCVWLLAFELRKLCPTHCRHIYGMWMLDDFTSWLIKLVQCVVNCNTNIDRHSVICSSLCISARLCGLNLMRFIDCCERPAARSIAHDVECATGHTTAGSPSLNRRAASDVQRRPTTTDDDTFTQLIQTCRTIYRPVSAFKVHVHAHFS